MEDFRGEKEIDVVIVGAGPAGAAAVKGLEGKGINTLVIEKKKLPRYKMCSGLIFPSAQEFLSRHFGEIPEGFYCEPKAIKGIKVFSSSGICIDIPQGAYKERENGEILSLWRKDFDNWLIQQSGAMIEDQCRFIKFQKENDRLVINVVCGDKEVVLNTKYLIGADGGDSAVRKVAIPGFDEREFLIVSYEEHWTGTIDLAPDYYYVFLDKRFSESLFASFCVKDDRLITVTSARLGSKVRGFHKRFLDYLKESHKFTPKKLVHCGGCICNLASFKSHFELGTDNVLLVGEAASFMGFCGEGITTALITGHIAAAAIIESMELGIEAISVYSGMVEDETERIIAQHERGRRLVI